MIWLVIGLMVGGGTLVYLAYMVLDIWLETKTAPREPMFFCAKHGFMRKEHTIKLIEWSDNPICPMCFSETMKAASRIPAMQKHPHG